jgi:dihydroxyacetone kinase-like protein
MSFDMAREMSGKSIASAIAGDDAAGATSIVSTGRRGVARHAHC